MSAITRRSTLKLLGMAGAFALLAGYSDNASGKSQKTATDGLSGWLSTTAEDNEKASVAWHFADKTLFITGAGDMPEPVDIETGSPWSVFADSIESISIDEGITSIPDAAFLELDNLQTIELPSTITHIGLCAFVDSYDYEFDRTSPWLQSLAPDANGCVTFENYLLSCYPSEWNSTVQIPSNITCIADAIGINNSIAGFEAADNDTFVTQDGVLFNADMTTLISFPAGKQVTRYAVPDTVQHIADWAFAYNNCLINIELPSSLKTIGRGAFIYCEGLSTINLPDALETIGAYAFCATGLVDATIPDSVTELGPYVFAGSRISNVTLSNSLTVIQTGTFSGCNLSQVTIPEGVVSIEEEAFTFSDLNYIDLPDSLQHIGVDVFSYRELYFPDESALELEYTQDGAIIADGRILVGAYAGSTVDPADNTYTRTGRLVIPSSVTCILDGIETSGVGAFESNSPYLATINGILYSGDGAILLRVPRSDIFTSIDVPDGVTTINPYAFSDSLVEWISLPESMDAIGNHAFSGCSSLSSISIPTSVTFIDHDAFDDCDQLVEINYAGTAQQWDKIYISNGNDCLLSAAIHFAE